MTRILRNLAVVASTPLATRIFVQAHMQMSWPYPPLSPLDPAVSSENKDYSYTSPLEADGSNYPCKNYQLSTVPGSYDIKETYSAGNTYNLSLAGSATHDGGSCQISLSYDNGETFKVIKSIIGGCPLTTSYDFTIPSYAPASNSALLVWSWFNVVGNREMYMNCARVAIQGSSQSTVRRKLRRRATIDDLPDMMACNVDNGCTTIEEEDVVYPNPGPDIQYGTDLINAEGGSGYTLSSTPTGDAFSTVTAAAPTSSASSQDDIAPYTNDTGPGSVSSPSTATGTGAGTGVGTGTAPTSTTTANESTMVMSNTPTSSPALPTLPTTTSSTTSTTFGTSTHSTTLTTFSTTYYTTSHSTSVYLTTSGSGFLTTTTSSTSSSSTSSSSPTPSAITLPSNCTPGTFACDSTSTFSQCVSTGSGTTYIYMGSVAAGMECSNGQIIRENDGSCTPSGALVCNGSNAFYICDEGGLINMGATAAGTVCENGEIVFAS